MTTSTITIAVVFSLFSFVQPPASPPPPAPPSAEAPAKPAKKPDIYDTKADAKAQIAAALAKARKENRRVLIQWGANWCGWCHKLHELAKSNREIAKTLSYEYDTVLVDVGQFDKNLDLATAYGADLKKHGLPYLTILDADAKPLANQETGSLEFPKDDKSFGAHDPAKVNEFLTRHKAPYPKAAELYVAALFKARTEKKMLLLHFGAPWCGWCHRLEDWMARPDIAPLIAKDFIDFKIDTDRTVGSTEIFTKFNVNHARSGIPWFVITDAEGTPIADSNRDGNNIGFPAAPEEITHFESMLTKARKNLTDSDVKTLIESLKSPPTK
jgi:thiol-disulfide isomerase/thioredoxin